jgi:hypothetical protein
MGNMNGNYGKSGQSGGFTRHQKSQSTSSSMFTPLKESDLGLGGEDTKRTHGLIHGVGHGSVASSNKVFFLN